MEVLIPSLTDRRSDQDKMQRSKQALKQHMEPALAMLMRWLAGSYAGFALLPQQLRAHAESVATSGDWTVGRSGRSCTAWRTAPRAPAAALPGALPPGRLQLHCPRRPAAHCPRPPAAHCPQGACSYTAPGRLQRTAPRAPAAALPQGACSALPQAACSALPQRSPISPPSSPCPDDADAICRGIYPWETSVAASGASAATPAPGSATAEQLITRLRTHVNELNRATEELDLLAAERQRCLAYLERRQMDIQAALHRVCQRGGTLRSGNANVAQLAGALPPVRPPLTRSACGRLNTVMGWRCCCVTTCSGRQRNWRRPAHHLTMAGTAAAAWMSMTRPGRRIGCCESNVIAGQTILC